MIEDGRCLPFVVLFTGRSGSTYLVEALDDHAAIRAEKEMFAAMRRQGCTGAQQTVWARGFLAARPYLDCRAVGFKTKAHDVLDRVGFAGLLHELGARVVVLQRRNVVKQTVSLINAMRLNERTGDWNVYDEPDRAASRPISIEEFEKYLGSIEENQAVLRGYAASLRAPVLPCWYEDLLKDEQSFLGRIFEFLGVEADRVRGTCLKNTSDDLRLAVANFDELRDRYRGTRYEEMFDETIVATPG